MNPPARFGRLARLYRWMEYFSFGPYLTECRNLQIDEATRCRSALIYGDGDGRFLAELVRRAPGIQIAAIDASAEMLQQTAQRLPETGQVRLIQDDALACDPARFPEVPFDLVVSHFFLDCFSEAEIASLLIRVKDAVCEDAIWIVSDFALPERSPARQIGALIVRSLYLAFGLMTGLTTRRLPDHARVMREAGWVFESRHALLFGLLVSERWSFHLRQNS
jgi:SAM-dependent methyltransferase